jgi:hypothetical protein
VAGEQDVADVSGSVGGHRYGSCVLQISATCPAGPDVSKSRRQRGD